MNKTNDPDSNGHLVERIFSELREKGFTISSRSPGARTSATDPSSSGSCACEEIEIGQVLSEEQIQKVGRENGSHVLDIPPDTIVTPLAKERANDLDVELRRQ